MQRLLFLSLVCCGFRLLYLKSVRVLKHVCPSWSDNKRRIFAVRVVSATHAFLSSIGCLASLLIDSGFRRELYDYQTSSAQYVFLFSTGYFLYDLFDMTIHGEAPNSKEYFVHHSLVLTAFAIIVWSGKLFGLAMIGLLVEVQTVFLHTRTMCRLLGLTAKNSAFYVWLMNTNLVCLFLFRFLPNAFLLLHVVVLDEKIPFALKTFLTAGLSFLFYHNCHLVSAMIKTDGFFGYEMQELDEDSVDPLGDVRQESER